MYHPILVKVTFEREGPLDRREGLMRRAMRRVVQCIRFSEVLGVIGGMRSRISYLLDVLVQVSGKLAQDPHASLI
jgi:hypothetical protein